MTTVTKSDFDAALQAGFRASTAGEYKALARAATETVASFGRADNDANWRLRDCPMCKGSGSAARKLFSKFGMDIVTCNQCSLTYSRQVLRAAADRTLYELSPSQSAYHQLKRNEAYTSLERIKCHYVVQEASRFLRGHSPQYFLDIGAGSGTLLKAGGAAGWVAEGIEGNAVFVGICRDAGLNVTHGYFPACTPQRRTYDVITMFDILEHVEAPLEFLQSVTSLLSNDGVLVLQVPNFRSLLVQIEGVGNNNFCVGHWNHFDCMTLQALCARAGLVTLAIETIISELDRILAYPLERVESAATTLAGNRTMVSNLDPHWLHDRQLGYKVLGFFRKSG